ncbi:hypothetical protein [Halorarius halobius]|uniref:hypothetical protein n=1 Tax=Halorarius halobius TaxID=2962671 RepID=UPI0020CCDC05|nr:hypothetical protein [Halorarius halobius]
MPSNSLPARAFDLAGRVWPLAAVPLVVSLLDVARLRSLLSNTDRMFSVTFGFPRAVSSLWSFVNAQPSGVGGPATLADVPVFAVSLVVSAVVGGLLAAGYLGSIDAAVDGEYDFVNAVRAYGRPLVGFSLLEAVAGVIGVGAALLAGMGAVVAAVLVLVVLAYLFYTAPYLVVVDDQRLVPALRRAASLATNDARVVGFFLAYLVVSAVVSVPVSSVAFAAPPVGVAVAVLVTAPLSLLLNVATLLFVRDLTAGGQSSDSPSASNMPVDM